jgi:hypothetical protein
MSHHPLSICYHCEKYISADAKTQSVIADDWPRMCIQSGTQRLLMFHGQCYKLHLSLNPADAPPLSENPLSGQKYDSLR